MEKEEFRKKLAYNFLKILVVPVITILLFIVQILISPSIGELFINVSEGKLYIVPIFGLILWIYVQFRLSEFIVDYFSFLYRQWKR